MDYKQWLKELATLYRETFDRSIEDSEGWQAAFIDGYTPVQIITTMSINNGN